MPDGSFITAAPFGGLSGQVVYTMPTNPPTTTVPAFPGQGFPISQSQITMVRGMSKKSCQAKVLLLADELSPFYDI